MLKMHHVTWKSTPIHDEKWTFHDETAPLAMKITQQAVKKYTIYPCLSWKTDQSPFPIRGRVNIYPKFIFRDKNMTRFMMKLHHLQWKIDFFWNLRHPFQYMERWKIIFKDKKNDPFQHVSRWKSNIQAKNRLLKSILC